MLSAIQEHKRRSPAVNRSLSPQEKSEKGGGGGGLLWFTVTKACMGIIMHKFTKKWFPPTKIFVAHASIGQLSFLLVPNNTILIK